MKCCNKELKLQTGKQDGKEMVYYICDTCGRKGKGKNQKEAETEFNDSIPGLNKIEKAVNYMLTPIVRKDIFSWSEKNRSALMQQSANFIDRPATVRMIEKNIRYVSNLSGKAWDKVWSTPEGQESISYALSEANYHAAILGEMGDLVPFSSSCEFIPSVECYKFGLESGKGAPFKDIQIYNIFENDQTDAGIKDGNFYINLKHGFPRGDIISVAVYATRTDSGKTIGDIYDVTRLLEKAEQHSPSYKSYLKDKEDFLLLRTSGKLDKDKAGRECIAKKGKYGEYFLYESDLKNPYDGPDRPEMLRKATGKSFFRPYMKTRNAMAMAEEWSEETDLTMDMAADSVLDKSMSQFESEGHPTKDPQNAMKIKDAEIIKDNTVGEQKKDLQKNEGEPFNENDNEFNNL